MDLVFISMVLVYGYGFTEGVYGLEVFVLYFVYI